MRSYLFVPGDDERKISKALASQADALILDLEDSVTASRKAMAREVTAAALTSVSDEGPKLFVRINPLTSGLAQDDLAAIMKAAPYGIMQPKSRSAADAVTLSSMLSRLEAEFGRQDHATKLLVLATELAAAVQNMAGYDASGPRLCGLTWGAEDLSADIGASATRNDVGAYTDVFAMARTKTLLAAKSASVYQHVNAIDTVYPNFRDEKGFAEDCAIAARDGFTAKLAIHPVQVDEINRIFTPNEDEIARARAIVAAFAECKTGVTSLEGQMLDRPHLLKAQRLIERAAAYGIA